MGLTYEPESDSLTLRAGSSPQESPFREISMLLSCLNIQGKLQTCSLICYNIVLLPWKNENIKRNKDAYYF